ncbi:MAG: L-rhamnose/proton symporter RhaT [Planctomycetota bacterium]|jgi:hypothetical protein
MAAGIALTMLGAFFLGTFALPIKYIKKYEWENTWGAFFLFAMFVIPVGFAALAVTKLVAGYADIPNIYIFGVIALSFLWGCGFCCWGTGLSMVGLSLGYSLTMGTMAFMGSVVPFFLGNADKALTTPGMIIIGGILVCIVGVGVNGYAGIQREKSQPSDEAEGGSKKSSMLLGVIVCVLAGLLSSGLNIAFHVGNSVDLLQFSVESGEQADLDEGRVSASLRQDFEKHGMPLPAKVEVKGEKGSGAWTISDAGAGQTYFASKKNEGIDVSLHGIDAMSKKLGNVPWAASLSTWTLIFIGGGISSVAYSIFLLSKKKSWGKFKVEGSGKNLFFAFLMAAGHFACIIFYGIGSGKLGALGTSVGFAIFQSGSILIGNGLGIFTGEWKGASSKSKTWLAIALAVLIGGIVVLSIGNAKM